jgi:OHCU decarboxylase
MTQIIRLDPAYPRDLIGYGRDAPDPKWPGGARLALQFVINYEEGGENCILHGDAASEAFLSEIVGAQAWPGQRHMNMESIYEYGSRVGFWRLWRMFSERRLPVTVFGIATAMARNPDAVAAMNEAGWEIASHGLKWIDYRDAPAEEEARHIAEAIRIHQEVAGARPLGFYQGRCSENTLRLTMEEQGFLYSADTYADELPYWLQGPHGPQLMVPYTLDANDMRFATPQGFNAGDQFFSYLKDAFDLHYAEGATRPAMMQQGAPRPAMMQQGAPRPAMMSIGLHCRLVGRPGRAAALARFLDHVQAHEGVWVTTRLAIARHWAQNHLPVSALRPSLMPRALFIERFGDVFEHTPAISEAAHRAGFTVAEDSAAGLHAALERVMRDMPGKAKLALLRAHPHLAGKLAAARMLTDDSTSEQSGAGLDQLTIDEKSRFTALNEAYTSRFGFPFIMAVKGRSKDEIIEAFTRRLDNDIDSEFNEALAQVSRIVRLRLEDRMGESRIAAGLG